MVKGFEEEVKALEEYGHDCCARIDDRIHECCKRIREAHAVDVAGYQLALQWKEGQPPLATYDALGNERHKAVCELRKLSTCSMWAHGFRDGLAAAIGVSKEGAPYDDGTLCKLISERLIYLIAEPMTASDAYAVLKEERDGVDTEGRNNTCDDCADATACVCDDGRAGNPLAAGVAPITTELRRYMEAYKPVEDGPSMVVSRIGTLGYAGLMEHCDSIDAIHAQLERDYRVACEVNERQDEQYADMVHKLDRAYEKNHNQRKQLTEVQEALHRRNEGELKARWQKEIDRLEREKKDLELQVAKMRLESIGPPKDADGEVIRVGDKVEYTDEPGVPRAVSSLYLDGEGWWVYVGFTGRRPDKYRHYRSDTWERIIYAAMQAARLWQGVPNEHH